LRTGQRCLRQRYRGHTDRSSWAARVFARWGEALVLALLLSGCLGAAGASAANPTPQKAPASTSSRQPSPDPAPQAEVKPSTSHTSTPTAPAIRRPVVVSSSPAPTNTSATTGTRLVQLATSPAATGAPSRGARVPPTSRRTATHTTAAHRSPATPRDSSQTTSIPFPLALPRDLLLLPRAALNSGADSRRNGVLLLLSAVAMGVLALASLALLRRLRRLEPR
jgi:hypothetical protein